MAVLLGGVVSAFVLGVARASEASAAPARTAASATTVTTATTAGDVSAAVPSLAGALGTPHGPYGATSDGCATCHRAHSGKAKNLLPDTAPQSKLCFTCHDGTGSALNVKSEYTDPAVPANNPATRSYYSHDVLATTTHTLGESDEFGGTLNRHTECSDCHNPHASTDASSVSTPVGTAWTAPGPLAGVSGVSVVNGAAGTVPAYTFLDGMTSPVTAEYQLCFKCHSSFTVQLSNAGVPASQDRLDAGVEFNPNNVSFHPVEAAGKNATAKMAASLAGASPYKLWTLTPSSTVRCTHCHTSGLVASANPLPAPGDSLATHTSPNRGLLLAKYENRVLKSGNAAYTSADFALCFLCHTDTPFTGGGSAATNFPDHRKHVAGIGGGGSGGTSIDTPGAGNGNALCAECHFRIHSTGTETAPMARLISFAPNVTASSGTLTWTSNGVGSGSCTLVCHGKRHSGESYP
jgi:predicted CXXCH cytochrome family protein